MTQILALNAQQWYYTYGPGSSLTPEEATAKLTASQAPADTGTGTNTGAPSAEILADPEMAALWEWALGFAETGQTPLSALELFNNLSGYEAPDMPLVTDLNGTDFGGAGYDTRKHSECTLGGKGNIFKNILALRCLQNLLGAPKYSTTGWLLKRRAGNLRTTQKVS